MPTDTPIRAGVKLGELTSSELANALRATSFLLSDVMTSHIADRVLLAKLSSLHGDLELEEADRRKLSSQP